MVSKEPKSGDLVFLTMAAHDWLCRKNKDFSVPFSGRIARIMEVIDWESEVGKEILEKRELSGKWGEYRTEDFKYVIEVYLPEIQTSTGDGVAQPQVFPLMHPNKPKSPLFVPIEDKFLDRMFGGAILEKYTKAVKEHGKVSRSDTPESAPKAARDGRGKKVSSGKKAPK